MALQIRKVNSALARHLATQVNSLRVDVATARSLFHADVTSNVTTGPFDGHVTTPMVITAASATSLSTSITLANQLKSFYNVHIADKLAHKAADATNVVSTTAAVDLTTVQALLNAIKTAFNAHLTQSGVHCTNDSTNTVATANATDQTTSNALANALATAFNAHIQSSPGGSAISILEA